MKDANLHAFENGGVTSITSLIVESVFEQISSPSSARLVLW